MSMINGHGHGLAASQMAQASSASSHCGQASGCGASGVETTSLPQDEVLLSDEAQAFLDESADGGGEDSFGPGKSGQSPAHRAKAALAAYPELADLPFGKLVSTLAKGGAVESLLPPPPPPEDGEGLAGLEIAAADDVDPLASSAPSEVEPVVAPAAGSDDDVALDLLESLSNQDDDESDPLLDLLGNG